MHYIPCCKWSLSEKACNLERFQWQNLGHCNRYFFLVILWKGETGLKASGNVCFHSTLVSYETSWSSISLYQIFVLRLIVHTGTKLQIAECEASFRGDFCSFSGLFSHVLLALSNVLSHSGSRIQAESRKWLFCLFCFVVFLKNFIHVCAIF